MSRGATLKRKDLFPSYDLAALRLATARAILGMHPKSKKAQVEFDDALKQVAHEVDCWRERNRLLVPGRRTGRRAG